MKTVLLNLPYRKKLIRRWVASYFAPNFLLPPLELMSLAAIVRQWKQGDAHIIDAIAAGLDSAAVRQQLRELRPDLLVTQLGFNSFAEDIQTLEEITRGLPRTTSIGFGYLPTCFPGETLALSPLDILVRGEPELTFSELYDSLQSGGGREAIDGISYLDSEGFCHNPDRPRIRDLDRLPFPDFANLNIRHYSESFMPGPIGLIMSARGCPHRCAFCVTTYGNELISRSCQNIIAEITQLQQRYGITHVRFMDDTFGCDPQRLRELCRGLAALPAPVTWSCLTRIGQFGTELLKLMYQAGCRRIYIGIESGSPARRDQLNKGIDPERLASGVGYARQYGIEVSGFFIVGIPGETDADIEQSLRLAVQLDLDYIIVTKLQYWPGTALGAQHPAPVSFTTLAAPTRGDATARRRQQYFYRSFYLRPAYLLQQLRTFGRSPRDLLRGAQRLLQFLEGDGYDDLI